MIAILEHELKSYFHSLTAYVFGAFLLLFMLSFSLYAILPKFEEITT